VYDFQNLISSLFSIDTSLENFHEDKISSFFVKLLTDRQTNRQRDKRHVKHNLVA